MTHYILIIIQSFLPIAFTSFVLVWWALRQDYLGGASSLTEYEQIKKAENQSRKAEKKRRKAARRAKAPEKPVAAGEAEPVTGQLRPAKRKFDPLHSKWMEFGGGFYGVVAFFTYAVIEFGEVWNFLLKLPNLFEHGLISLAVNFFIESIRNFVAAIAWPAYWLQRIHSDQWLWAIGAYAGYWLGARAAFKFHGRKTA